MPVIPVINLSASEAGAPTTGGVYAPNGLSGQTPPQSWQPNPDSVRAASVPSPFAAEEVASFLLRRGADHAITTGCKNLLYGLVSGAFSFRWVRIGMLGAGELREALMVYAKDHPIEPRIGLISARTEDGSSQTVGFVGAEGFPVPANQGPENLDALLGTRRDVEVACLLDNLRQSLARQDKWNQNESWMRLIDRVIRGCTNEGTVPIDPNAVRLDADVRSIGPFALPLDGKPLMTYLLAYAPGFVARLDQALGLTQVDPSDRDGEFGATLLRQGSMVVARFLHYDGEPMQRRSRGEGLVSFLADAVSANAVGPSQNPAILNRPDGNRFSLYDHLFNLKATLGCDLKDALTGQAHQLSDIGRVVGRYRGAAVGEQGLVRMSDAGQVAARMREAEIRELERTGRAVRLDPEQGAPDVVFLEELTQEGRPATQIGDLSGIGGILWHAFAKAERWSVQAGLVAYCDEDAFERPLEFPLIASREAVEAWRPTSYAWRNYAATVHRFLAAYAAPDAQAHGQAGQRLAAASARAHVRRWLGEESLGELERMAAPRLTLTAAASIPLILRIDGPAGGWDCSYGTLPVFVDPLR